MRRLGERVFPGPESRAMTDPLVVSAVSDAVKKAKDLKEVQDRNYQAVGATRGEDPSRLGPRTPAAAR